MTVDKHPDAGNKKAEKTRKTLLRAFNRQYRKDAPESYPHFKGILENGGILSTIEPDGIGIVFLKFQHIF